MKLNKIDLLIWFSSLIIVFLSFVFTSNDYLTLIASLIGVTSLIFIAKGYVLGEILAIVFSMIYGYISFKNRYYGELITYVFMTLPMSVLALISWIKHPYKDSKEVQVNKVNSKNLIVIAILSFVISILLYFLLKYFNTNNLIISTISITTSFVAASFSFLRSPYYAIAYAFNDIVLIILWSFATSNNISYFPMIICFVAFLANDIYGFICWEKMKKRQSQNDNV